MNQTDQLIRLLETSSGNPLDIHFTLYKDFLSKSENPEKLLQIILEYTDEIGNSNDDSPTLISEKEVSDFLFVYFDLISAITRNIVVQNLSVEDFYKKLYANIFVSDILPHHEKDQAILLYTLNEKIPGIPYHHAEDLVKMDDEQYNQIIDSIEEQLSLAVYMLNRRFRSKTEETSQLWKIAASLESKEQQIVFWAVIINIIRRHERKSYESPEHSTDD